MVVHLRATTATSKNTNWALARQSRLSFSRLHPADLGQPAYPCSKTDVRTQILRRGACHGRLSIIIWLSAGDIRHIDGSGCLDCKYKTRFIRRLWCIIGNACFSGIAVTEVLSFDAAIQSFSDLSKRHFLLGNGLSISLKPDI